MSAENTFLAPASVKFLSGPLAGSTFFISKPITYIKTGIRRRRDSTEGGNPADRGDVFSDALGDGRSGFIFRPA